MAFLRTLGALELRSTVGEVVSRRRKELSLLAYLAARAPSSVSRDELTALFWDGTDPDRARHSLRQALSSLRRHLGPGLEAEPGVRLRGEALTTDASRFADLAGRGHAEEALALWRGEFLEGAEDAGGVDFRIWLEASRERLRVIRRQCFESLASECEARGDWSGLVEACQTYAEAFPGLERPHARLVEALVLAARTGEAAHAHRGYLARAQAGEVEPPGDDFLSLGLRLGSAPRERGGSGGRSREPLGWSEAFQTILTSWRTVLDGDAASVWVTGSPGAGKTRLMRELARWLALRSPEALVLSTQAPAGGPVERRAAERLFGPLRYAPGIGAASDSALSLAAEVVPSLRDRFPLIPVAHPLAALDPHAVAAALGEVVAAVAGEVPVTLLADDIQDLDPWHAHLLGELSANPVPGTMVVCAADAEADAAAGSPWAPPPGADLLQLAPPQNLRPQAHGPLRPGALVAGLVATAAVVVSLLVPRGPGAGSALTDRVVAVGEIRVYGLPDSLQGLPELLSANLARIHGVQILSGPALLALVPDGREPSAAEPPLAAAARRGGATQLVEGTLTKRSDGHLRLDLTRTDLASGRILRAYAVESDEAFDLVDLTVERVARDLGGASAMVQPTGGHASLVSYRLFEEGLRAYHDRDHAGARALFSAALAEDSTLALAAYYLSLVSDTPERWDLLARAARLSESTNERDRLLIQSEFATYMGDASRLAKAESLVARYPMEPSGRYLLGSAMVAQGDFLPALRHLRWVVAYDSAALSGRSPRCLACEALDRMGEALYLADSAAASERIARSWIALQPRSAAAWLRLSSALEAQDRFDEALEALGTAAELQPVEASLVGRRTSILLRRGDYEGAIGIDRARLMAQDRGEREAALWGLVIAYRQQGRLEEALEAARSFRSLAGGPPADPDSWLQEAVPEATVLFDMGRFAEAAALWDSIADTPPRGASEARRGRFRAWTLTHAATAYAALGDSARLRSLEDTIRVQGARSAFGRDQRLHHHVRGLRLQMQGRWGEAAEAFRESLYSPVEGYGRTGLELGRSLVRAGRPQEAVAALRSALRGPIGASGMYVTRLELHSALADAFEGAGAADSAAVYVRRVAEARGSAPGK